MIRMFVKLGVSPFHSWFISILKTRSLKILFILSSVQKFIPLVILNNIIFNYIVFYIIVFLNLIILVYILFSTISFNKILALSSILNFLINFFLILVFMSLGGIPPLLGFLRKFIVL